MKLKAIAGVLAIALISAPALAAKPKKFMDGEPVTLANGTVAKTSTVECTGGSQFSLTNEDGQWCFAGDEKFCHKNKIKAAQKACKSK